MWRVSIDGGEPVRVIPEEPARKSKRGEHSAAELFAEGLPCRPKRSRPANGGGNRLGLC